MSAGIKIAIARSIGCITLLRRLQRTRLGHGWEQLEGDHRQLAPDENEQVELRGRDHQPYRYVGGRRRERIRPPR
jgi:hypothetical protein